MELQKPPNGCLRTHKRNFAMVLKYANNGCLRDYLKNHFQSLQWKDKIQMALDITCGIMCLHTEDIIHRDLVNKALF